jgi:DNA-binding transcriptional LysR family regulator
VQAGAAQFRKSGSGPAAVVASSLTGGYLLPEMIAEFQHSHPGVRVTLQVGTAEQAVELFRSHHAELGFVAGAVAAPEIETEPLFEYDVVIVGKSALVPRRPSRDSLERVTWVSREAGSATRVSSGAGLARLGIVPRHRLELPSNEALVYALKRGYGIAAISRYVVAAERRTGSLAAIQVRGWNVRKVVSVLRVRDAKLTPSADRFQTFRAHAARRNGPPASTLTTGQANQVRLRRDPAGRRSVLDDPKRLRSFERHDGCFGSRAERLTMSISSPVYP